MGSSFSITNDTDGDIWVWRGATLTVVNFPIPDVITALDPQFVADVGPIPGNAAAVTYIQMVNRGLLAPTVGITGLSVVDPAIGTAVNEVKCTLNISDVMADDLIRSVLKFRKVCDVKLRSGEMYKHNATLSLASTVWLMNENGEQVLRNVRTAPIDGHNNSYYVSKDWKWKHSKVVKFVTNM